jgi:hypothetical protein
MERRAVVSGGLLGLTALLGAGDGVAEAAQRADNQADNQEVARAIDELRGVLELRLAAPFVELTEINALAPPRATEVFRGSERAR